MAESYGNFRERSETTIWNSLNRLLIIFLVMIVAAGMVAFFMPQLAHGRTRQAEIDALREKVDQQKALLARQTRELRLLQTSPEYVEIFARDRLDMMKEGETVFRVDAERK